jgi:hypothetical protein
MSLLSFLRSKVFRAVVSSMLMLQVINLSIDAVDPSPCKEDLTVNEIESCVEFVLEVILKKENTINETDDQDAPHHRPVSTFGFFSEKARLIVIENEFELQYSKKKLAVELQLESLTQSITSPPPRDSSVA